MNSMSRPHDNDDRACGCKKEKQKEAEAILKCKDLSPVTVPTPSAAGVTNTLGGSITLNTCKFCLPCTKFEFASNIITVFPALASSATIRFQLYKLCKGDTVRTKVGPEWVITIANITDTVANTANDIASFFICDCDCDCDCDENDCCTYTVDVIINNSAGTLPTSVTINNPTLSALVVEKNVRCC
ncbi:MAG: hypothetical protein ACI8WT_003864 [Clostridium sp.]|jgi:hypothetical protein